MPYKIFNLASVLLLLSPANLYADMNYGVISFEANKFRSDKGFVRAVLFARDAGFPLDHNQAIQKLNLRVTEGSARGTFKAVPYGNYAISYYHDEDNNNKMNTYFMGVPKEGVGTSRDATGTFGPPQWKDAVFSLQEKSSKKVISTQYLELKNFLR